MACIRKTLVSCLEIFDTVCRKVIVLEHLHPTEGVQVASWTDELGRLRIWAANIGAHQIGHSSLKFRLRDASHIRQQIVDLLVDLSHTLKDITGELESSGNAAREDEAISDVDFEENLTSEILQLHEEVVNIIDCLYQMSMLVRRPA